jgi:hypothetical protein
VEGGWGHKTRLGEGFEMTWQVKATVEPSILSSMSCYPSSGIKATFTDAPAKFKWRPVVKNEHWNPDATGMKEERRDGRDETPMIKANIRKFKGKEHL